MGLYKWYANNPDYLKEDHDGRLSSKAPLLMRILVREGFLKGDGLYGGTVPKGEARRKAIGYERHWIPRRERPVRKRAKTRSAPKARRPRKSTTAWTVSHEKGKVRVRNF
jgi:hypothetical protein